ncbi:MAG: hypothetical protein Q9217_005178, partial [Psora testacea]
MSEPKGVEHTHFTLQRGLSYYRYQILNPGSHQGTWLSDFPLAGIAAKIIFLEMLKSRNRLIIYDHRSFSLDSYLNCLLHFCPETIPASKRALDALASCTSHPNLSFINGVLGSSQIVPKKTRLAVNTLCGGRSVFRSSYASTEAICMTRQMPDGQSKESTCQGFPLESAEGRVLDDAGSELPVGREGNLFFRTPSMMKGYWRNPKLTAETIDKHGWYNTGDIGYVDAKTGEWHVTGRSKEIIKVRGRSVSPHAIEECLLRLPEVAVAVVVGVQREDGEELPVAFIVDEGGLTDDDVEKHMQKQMNQDYQITG